MNDFFDGFDECPERTAFFIDDKALTYRELDLASAAYAAGLIRLGISAGDRVAIQAESSRMLLIALLGHLRSGVIHVPINTRYQPNEVRHILTDSGASLVLSDKNAPAHTTAKSMAIPHLSLEELPQGDEPIPATAPKDSIAMLIYTSGTTGRSKGVALDRRALIANIGATTRLWQWTAADHLVLALPLFHVHGLGLGILGTLLNQMSATVHRRFAADAVVQALADGATIFMGVPTMYARLTTYLRNENMGRVLSKARLFTSGSAALPASAHEDFEQLTSHRILERYGMSETGFTLSNPYGRTRKAGSVGMPVAGYEVRVVDEDGQDCQANESGEIWVRGTGLMRGYWGQPEVTAAAFTNGWFRTGDVARVDPEGYHHILGRKSADIIKSGGFKISALEIENVLLTHPAVSEAAVVGLPCNEWGERIVAALVIKPGKSFAPEDILALAKRELAGFKCPRAIYPMETLPRNALGKLQKHRLKTHLLTQQ
jgi:acyl-CoA synthetase (AMP-forming)/AMP-acid ligase II